MSIAKNYLYNVIYQISILIIPLITIPYISRVLGSNGVGINAYTNSIIQYFILLGTIGISLYGNREVAYVRDDKDKLSLTFWGIFSLKLITTLISYFLFLFFLSIVEKHHTIFLLQSIYIIAVAIDISWLYMGLEDFKKTVLRNLLVKVIGVICTFIFIKSPDDLWKYVLILSVSQLLGNLSLWVYIPKTINKVKISWADISKHLLPSISLFIPQVAIQVYVVLNKTMLGLLSTPSEVGFFDNADKIVKVVLSLVTAVGTVMLPRVSNTFAKGDIRKVREYVYKSFNFVSYLSIPLMFGIAGIATQFAPWFFGHEFSKSGVLMTIMSPVIVFIAWSNVLGNQFLMPTGKVKGYTLSVIVGAIVNLFLNLILITHLHSIGTAVSTIIAELSVTITQMYLVRKELQINLMIKSIWKFLLAGLMMFIVIILVGEYIKIGTLTIIIQFFIGIIIYIFILFLLKSKLNKQLFLFGFSILNGFGRHQASKSFENKQHKKKGK